MIAPSAAASLLVELVQHGLRCVDTGKGDRAVTLGWSADLVKQLERKGYRDQALSLKAALIARGHRP